MHKTCVRHVWPITCLVSTTGGNVDVDLHNREQFYCSTLAQHYNCLKGSPNRLTDRGNTGTVVEGEVPLSSADN